MEVKKSTWVITIGVLVVIVIVMVLAIFTITNAINNYATGVTEQIKVNETKNQTMIFELKSGISQNDKRRGHIIKTKKFIMSVNPKITIPIAEQYAEYIVTESQKYTNVDYKIISAIVAQESRFRFESESIVGARGLMQIMPETAEDMMQYLHLTFDSDELYSPRINIRVGTYYFHRLMTKYKNEQYALAAYNGGYWQAKRWQLLKKPGAKTPEESEQILKIPDETMKYVPSTLNWKTKFVNLVK